MGSSLHAPIPSLFQSTGLFLFISPGSTEAAELLRRIACRGRRERERALLLVLVLFVYFIYSGCSAAAMWGAFDLERHFAFYGAYHSAPGNVLIHTIFVWPIFFTSLLLFYYTPPFFHPTLPLLGPPLVFNFGFAFAAFYALFYVCLDRRAGSLAALLCALCWVGSCALGSHLGFSLGWKVALVSQLICWIGQFIGHGVFEGRAPALLDNLTQALLMAPLFVLLEVLHWFFSYESYPGFHERVRPKIDAERKQWEARKQKKSY